MNVTNVEWLKTNEEKIKQVFPETWTHVSNVSLLQIGFKFKTLDIDWRSEDQLAKLMVYFTKIGMLERHGMLVRRAPHSIFGEQK